MPINLPLVENPFVHQNSSTTTLANQGQSESFAEAEVEAWNFEYDHEEIDKAIQEALPPEGAYQSRGLAVKRTITNGRRSVRYYGKVYRDGKEAHISLFTSPEKAQSKKDPSKLDFSYVQFVKCRDAYAEYTGQNPRNQDELDTFMTTKPIEFYLRRGTDSMMVNSIKGLKALA